MLRAPMAQAKKYEFSKHAEQEVQRRAIPRAWVEAVLAAPEQRFAQSDHADILQSRFVAESEKMCFGR